MKKTLSMMLLKKISFAFVVTLFVILLTFVNQFASQAATGSNLIINGSFTATIESGAHPANWTADYWGNLSANLSLNDFGYDDASSVHISVTDYNDGDAKWIPDTVNVVAGESYVYSDVSKSDTTTHIWARYTLANGTNQYQWLKAVSASSVWQTNNVTMVAPVSSTAVSVFHVLNSNGSADIDNASLMQVTACPKTIESGVFNGSFEQNCVDGSQPDYWKTQLYGTINAQFNYAPSGVVGNRSVGITVLNTSGGEASWVSDAIPVAAQTVYQLRARVQSTASASYAYVEYHLSDGSISYAGLTSFPPTGASWSNYTDSFSTPVGTQAIRLYFALASTGNFSLDDVQMAQVDPSAKVLPKGVVTIAFDDGLASSYNNALPILKKAGYTATWYLNGSTIGTSGYMTKGQVKQLVNSNQEIGSHSYQHLDMVSLTSDEQVYQITTNKQFLEQLTGKSITSFATPYGSYNSQVLSNIMTYHQTQRDTSGAMNMPYSYNQSMIHGKDVTQSFTTADIKSLLQATQDQKGWLVLVYHGISSTGDEYTISKATFQQQIKLLKNYDIVVQNITATANQLK